MATLFKAIGATGGTPRSMFSQPDVADYYMTFEMPAGTDYVVPAGKTLKVTKIYWPSGAAGTVKFGYADEAVPSQAAEPTGATYLMPHYFTVAVSTWFDVYFEVPATKYPFAKVAVAWNCMIIFGIEE